MKKLYKGHYYHKINLNVPTASDYFMSRLNKIIRVKNGQIFEMKPKVQNGTKLLEVAILGKYNPVTKRSERKLSTYNMIFANLFLKKKQNDFCLREIDGIPRYVTKEEFTDLTFPLLEPFIGKISDSNCSIKKDQLESLKKLKSEGKSIKQLSKIYKCSLTSVTRALKRIENQKQILKK